MNQSKYFYRKVVFTKKEGQTDLIVSFDPHKSHPLEPWLGLVFSLADGQHTIRQLLDHMEARYQEAPPIALERTVSSTIDRLVDYAAIELCDSPYELPLYLSQPIEEQDMEASFKLMQQDGYIKEQSSPAQQ